MSWWTYLVTFGIPNCFCQIFWTFWDSKIQLGCLESFSSLYGSSRFRLNLRPSLGSVWISVLEEFAMWVLFFHFMYKGSVDHFYDFWIQKSHHFDDFWIQKCFGPYLRFLDPETAVFLQFLDPEIGPFLQFLDPEVFWSIFTISGSRNCSISAVYGSRNSTISTISGYKHSTISTISGYKHSFNFPKYLYYDAKKA